MDSESESVAIEFTPRKCMKGAIRTKDGSIGDMGWKRVMLIARNRYVVRRVSKEDV